MDGLSTLQEYQLYVTSAGAAGKPQGVWKASAIPKPPEYTLISTMTLIECASNGMMLVRVTGSPDLPQGSTHVWSPAAQTWTRVLPPPGAENAVLTPLDVNSSGQVVGYFNSVITMGFLWDPATGASRVFELDGAMAIPTRISDAGFVVGNVGGLGGRSFGGDADGDEISFPGVPASPVFHDVNDYAEFVGTVYNPTRGRYETFLAAPGQPVFLTGIDAGLEDLQSIWSQIPDIDPDAIQWTPDPSSWDKGTAIDRRTGAVVQVSRGYGAEFYWLHDPNAPTGGWLGYPGFSQTFGAVNDWGEFAGIWQGVLWEAGFDANGQMLYGARSGQSPFFFDGSYHATESESSIFSVTNDPAVLIGSPFAIWKSPTVISVTAVLPDGYLNNATIAAARMADNGRVFFQPASGGVSYRPIHLLEPDQDSDGDGMPDDWEAYYQLNPNDPSDRSGDADGDGVPNYLEFRYRGIPATPIPDLRPGIDTDGDGMPNVWEWKHNLDYENAAGAAGDEDNDGLTNLQEFHLGTDPNNEDTDGDGLSDQAETILGTDGARADSNSNGTPDGDDPATYQNTGLPALPYQAAPPGAPPEPLMINAVRKKVEDWDGFSVYWDDDDGDVIEPFSYEWVTTRDVAGIVSETVEDWTEWKIPDWGSVQRRLRKAAFPPFKLISESERDSLRVGSPIMFAAAIEYWQIPTVEDATINFGNANSTLIRMERARTEPIARSRTFLKIYRTHIENGGYPENSGTVVRVETLVLTIPAGGLVSEVAKVEATEDGLTCDLLPVEIVQPKLSETGGKITDENGIDEIEVVDTIRFCRWLDSFTGNALNSDCADKDRDRFRIRIPAVLPDLTKIHIKSFGLATAVINGQWVSKYTDGDYDVTMTEENGAMVSKWMLLVSDGDDDVDYNGIGTDNGTNDQTLLANFNSPVEVTLPEYQNAQVTFHAQKPLGDVEIQPYYLSPAGDVPADMERFITNHLEKMKEIYRQIGVRVGHYGIVGKSVPLSWFDPKSAPSEAAKYFTPSESNLARAAVRGFAVPGKQIRIGFVDATLMQNSGNPFDLDPKQVRGFTVQDTDGIIVSMEPNDARFILGVTAHEVGHALGLPHTTSTWQRWLMKGDGIIWNHKPLEHSKRLQLGDFEIIRNRQSSYVPYVPN